MSKRREPLHEPVKSVERARRAEVLLHPGDGFVAYADGLSHHHADKGAERTHDQHKENKQREQGGERLPATEQLRDPAIERPA